MSGLKRSGELRGINWSPLEKGNIEIEEEGRRTKTKKKERGSIRGDTDQTPLG